jgi:hypothetical protein
MTTPYSLDGLRCEATHVELQVLYLLHALRIGGFVNESGSKSWAALNSSPVGPAWGRNLSSRT